MLERPEPALTTAPDRRNVVHRRPGGLVTRPTWVPWCCTRPVRRHPYRGPQAIRTEALVAGIERVEGALLARLR